MHERYPASEEELRRHFTFFDDDKSGFIDFPEYQDMLRIMGFDADSDDAARSFDDIDSDGDGEVSFQEFMVWWRALWHD